MKLDVLLVLSLLSSNAAAATGSLLLYYCNATGCSLNWRVIDSERDNSSITLAKFNGRSTVGQLIKSTNPDGTRVSYASVLLEQKVNANSTQRSSVLFLSEDYSSQRNSIQCKSGRIQDADYFPLIGEQHIHRLAELPHTFLFCNASGRYLKWRIDGRTIGLFNGHETPGNSTKSTNVDGTVLHYSSILLSRRQNNMNKTERTSLLILSNEFRRRSIQRIGESGNQTIYSVSTQTTSRPISTQAILDDQRTTLRIEMVALNSALYYVVPYRVAFLVAIFIIGILL